MLTKAKTPLRRLREELGITQENLAQSASVTVQWYRQIENNPAQPTSYTTAQNILAAINTERITRSLEALHLDQLGLKIV